MGRRILPIQFCLDDSKFLPLRPVDTKKHAFSPLIPGDNTTYIYNTEEEYMNQYADSYYAFTWKKAGWDCMRHLEIIAAGAVPYFKDLADCPKNILTKFPKTLVLQAMHLPGVSEDGIDFTLFDKHKYDELRRKIYDHAYENLTSIAMASYVLDQVIPTWSIGAKVLYLSADPDPDYMRCMLLIGMKRLLGENCTDVVKVPHIYASYDGDLSKLYGKGMNYTRILEDDPYIERSLFYIYRMIERKYFDIVIFGSIHRCSPNIHRHVMKHYEPKRIIHVCGEDHHDITQCINHARDADSVLFLREFFLST